MWVTVDVVLTFCVLYLRDFVDQCQPEAGSPDPRLGALIIRHTQECGDRLFVVLREWAYQQLPAEK